MLNGYEGPQWDPGWGSLASYADETSGLDATQACCACGGLHSELETRLEEVTCTLDIADLPSETRPNLLPPAHPPAA